MEVLHEDVFGTRTALLNEEILFSVAGVHYSLNIHKAGRGFILKERHPT